VRRGLLNRTHTLCIVFRLVQRERVGINMRNGGTIRDCPEISGAFTGVHSVQFTVCKCPAACTVDSTLSRSNCELRLVLLVMSMSDLK
jgi:hypothetical protein